MAERSCCSKTLNYVQSALDILKEKIEYKGSFNMLLRYFYDEKLAHASYVVGCQAKGEMVIVDPMRNIEPYLALAEKRRCKLLAH